MKQIGHYAAAAAKYMISALIVGYIALLLLFVGVSRRPFEEVSQNVSEAIDTDRLSEQDSQTLKRNFGLNSSEFSGVLYYASVSGISAEEVLLIQTTDDSQIIHVTDALEEHVEKRMEEFGGYMPEQAALLENAGQSVTGNYIFFVVSQDADRYMKAFADSL